MNNFPFGECECRDGCQCSIKPGPAAYILKRDGVQIKCCTRCNLSEDKIIETLVKSNYPASDFMRIFFDYDPLSIFVLGGSPFGYDN